MYIHLFFVSMKYSGIKLLAVLVGGLLPGVASAAISPVAEIHPGDFIKLENSSAIYYINEDNQRLYFPYGWVFKCFEENYDKVKTVSASVNIDEHFPAAARGVVAPRPGCDLVKTPASPAVYAFGFDGVRHKIENETAARTLYGDNWATKVHDVPDFILSLFPIGVPFDGSTPHPGQIIREVANGPLYMIGEDSRYYPVEDNLPEFLTNDVYIVSPAQWQRLSGRGDRTWTREDITGNVDDREDESENDEDMDEDSEQEEDTEEDTNDDTDQTPTTSTAAIWKPTPGTTWQWQLSSAPTNTAYDVDMYDIDLFDASKELVEELHDNGKKVVCYINVGAWEDWREDADDFPEQILGDEYDGWEGERWLDIRASSTLYPLLEKRLDLCQEKGFDGVEPDNIDGYQNDTGFPISSAQQLEFNMWLANEAHERGLSIGLKNDPEQAKTLYRYFDWALTEDCAEDDWCEDMSIFVKSNKAVFQSEYTDNDLEFDATCSDAEDRDFSMILKRRDLDEWVKFCD